MSDEAARRSALQTDRNILLQAPAGSGKTTVLAQRFLSALARVTEPEQVLAITFTRKAAAEMRERVLVALDDALPPDQPDRATWQTLCAEVRAQAQRCGWKLAELPVRLRIQTIDSLAHEIARAMPLLGRMVSNLRVIDQARDLYDEAARETLRYGESQPEYRRDTDLLLTRLDNDWERARALLAELLPSRNRWQPLLLAHEPHQLASRVMESLRRIAADSLQQTHAVLSPALLEVAAEIAAATAANRRDAGHDDEGAWRAWLAPDASLSLQAPNLRAWQAVAALALKEDGEPRARVDVRHGFPPSDKSLKTRWLQWLHSLQQQPGAMQSLAAIAALPQPVLDDHEQAVLTALARLMLLAAMHLKLVFRERGLVDHSEVSAVARQALHDMEGPSELSIRNTLRVHHLLVDEFQDTSPEQLDLVRDLIAGWEAGDARSLFLVGDPMQSIYLFRNSEVGLFLQTRIEGVGNVALESLHLTRNFRSQQALVEWANGAFHPAFPQAEDLRSSAVRFLPSDPARTPDAGLPATVAVWPQPDADTAAEAQAIAAEAQALRSQQPDCSIAVLVQTRALAAPILRALQAAGIPTLGVDLASLADRAAVRDLVAIGQALMDGGDRSAWLAVLRSPACGFALADLLALSEIAGGQPLVDVLGDEAAREPLSTDGQRRMLRIGPVLARAWQQRGSLDPATAIEDLWQQLGGPHTARNTGDLAAAHQYLLALRRLTEQQGGIDAEGLQRLAEQLRDHGDAQGEHPVEVLTIHRAKGLEWDVVFVPGLGKLPRPDRPPLLRWLQLPAPGGDSDLLLAVHSIGEPNASDPLARYIARLQNERQQNERLRLLYVAVTRARRRLYLSGHAARRGPDGVLPAARSLLGLLWARMREHFGPVTSAAEEDAAAVADGPQESPWPRLPADFAAQNAATLPRSESLSRGAVEAAAQPEFSWVGPLARAAGTVMHAEFERLAREGSRLAEDAALRIPACAAQLREHGIAADQAWQTAAAMARQLNSLQQDARVRWLLSTPHRDARTELRLSGVVAGELRNVVIDRSFVDAGTRWVIDYKTSVHAGGGLAEFLEREVLRYAPQLRLYRTLAQRLGPEPVRAALYFPWLREFREVDCGD